MRAWLEKRLVSDSVLARLLDMPITLPRLRGPLRLECTGEVIGEVPAARSVTPLLIEERRA